MKKLPEPFQKFACLTWPERLTRALDFILSAYLAVMCSVLDCTLCWIGVDGAEGGARC